MGPIRCPATSVEDYHSTFRNIPEERGSRQLRGGSLKSQLQSAQAPSVNFKTVVVLTSGTASFKGALLQNFNKTFVPEPLITRVKQLEDIFSIVRTNFCT